MSRRIGLVVIVSLVVFSSQIWARGLSTTVSFTGSVPSLSSTGPCSSSSSDYDHYCPSGTCECEEFTGVLSGPLVGTDKNATLNVTIDLGATTTLSETEGCVPFFAVMKFTTLIKKIHQTENETDNIVGTICSNSSTPDKDSISGGLGIVSSDVGATGGWGTLTSGSIDNTKTPGILKIRSKVFIPGL